jgi:hypothetical protein
LPIADYRSAAAGSNNPVAGRSRRRELKFKEGRKGVKSKEKIGRF